jgi:hypothetical protein
MQDDSADQIFEEFQDIVQQAILQGFPNPERKGCPGTEVLRELANRPRPTRDDSWEHVTHCSPCYSDFLGLRRQVKTRLELERRHMLQRRVVLAGLAILAIGIVIAGYELFLRGSVTTPREADAHEPALLDLRNQSTPRNAGTATAGVPTPILPAKRLSLKILLPIGSEPGPYEIQFLDNTSRPILQAAGEAHIENGTTLLYVLVDLRGRTGSAFRLGLRRIAYSWAYYPVEVE